MTKRPPKPWIAPLIVSVVILLLALGGWLLMRGVYFPVLAPSGEVANQQSKLIIFTVLLSLIVAVPVFIMLALFAWKFRAGNSTKVYKPDWAVDNRLEAVWWGIPIAIIVLLSFVTYFTSHSLDPYRAIESDKDTLEVEVVALQWKWLFIYPDQTVATVNDLTIPVNTPVHFRLSADAPMSAFWIPALGSQIYSMNAMSSQLNLIANNVGSYTGYNTNINGEGYSKMQFAVNSVSQSDFDKWTKKVADSKDDLTMPSYRRLAEPSTPDKPLYFRLSDDNLYNSIIMKYMDHGGVDNTQNAEHGAPEPVDEAIDPVLRNEDLNGDVKTDQPHHERANP